MPCVTLYNFIAHADGLCRHLARERHEDQTSQLKRLGTLVKGLETKLEYMQETTLLSTETATAFNTYKDFTSASSLALKQIETSIKSMGGSFAQTKPVTNKHFDIPKPVDQFYTGREREAEQLKTWLLSGSCYRRGSAAKKTLDKQKRFVIYGVGGSGKTQFCCKYAEDNRDW